MGHAYEKDYINSELFFTEAMTLLKNNPRYRYNDEYLMKELLDIAHAYGNNASKQSEPYFEEALMLAQENIKKADPNFIAYLFYKIGVINTQNNNDRKAISYFKMLLKIFKSPKITVGRIEYWHGVDFLRTLALKHKNYPLALTVSEAILDKIKKHPHFGVWEVRDMENKILFIKEKMKQQ